MSEIERNHMDYTCKMVYYFLFPCIERTVVFFNFALYRAFFVVKMKYFCVHGPRLFSAEHIMNFIIALSGYLRYEYFKQNR